MKTSTAYDLSQFAPVKKREPKVEVVKTPKKRSGAKTAFSIKTAAYLIVLSLLMSGTVYSRLQLTEVKSQISNCNSDLTEIESENAYLSYQVDSMVSLKNAEEYAVSELGLIKLDSNQIEYVSLQDENAIEVNDVADSENSFTTFINLVIEFFGG